MRYLLTILLITLALIVLAQHGPVNVKENTRIIVKPIEFPCTHYFFEHEKNDQVITEKGSYRQIIEEVNKVYLRYKGGGLTVTEKCVFPNIDFSKYTLLGKYAGGNNYCSVQYSMDVTNDAANRQYIFTVTVNQKGRCKRASRWQWHWVLVSKLPDDYVVKFEVEYWHDGRSSCGNITDAIQQKINAQLISRMGSQRFARWFRNGCGRYSPSQKIYIVPYEIVPPQLIGEPVRFTLLTLEFDSTGEAITDLDKTLPDCVKNPSDCELISFSKAEEIAKETYEPDKSGLDGYYIVDFRLNDGRFVYFLSYSSSTNHKKRLMIYVDVATGKTNKILEH